MPRYVAMGSSFASGPGIEPILDVGCERSGRNYASLVAERLGYDLVDVTSGGATVDDLTTRRQELRTGGSVPPQLEAVGADTDVVTVTVGGNDVDYVGTLCRSSFLAAPTEVPPEAAAFLAAPIDPDAVATALEGLPAKLASLVAAVRDRAPRARILLVQYLALVPEDEGGCARVPMSETHRALGADIGRRLAAATAQAAAASGAELVELTRRSGEHTACSAEPWVTGWEMDDPAAGIPPYHPNAAGMRAVADAVVAVLTGRRADAGTSQEPSPVSS